MSSTTAACSSDSWAEGAGGGAAALPPLAPRTLDDDAPGTACPCTARAKPAIKLLRPASSARVRAAAIAARLARAAAGSSRFRSLTHSTNRAASVGSALLARNVAVSLPICARTLNRPSATRVLKSRSPSASGRRSVHDRPPGREYSATTQCVAALCRRMASFAVVRRVMAPDRALAYSTERVPTRTVASISKVAAAWAVEFCW